MTDFEQIGGHTQLQAILKDFVARVFGDFIIGYLFEGHDQARITAHEVSHATAHLGGPKAYTGRPIGAVHRPLRINKGHFRRRLAILRTTLRDHGVDEALIERWIATDAKMERIITDGTDCGPPPAVS